MKFCILFLAVSAIAFGQTALVTGRVLDPQGRPVPGTRVHLLVRIGSVPDDVAQASSDEAGGYRFEGLIAGMYTVRADSQEFEPAGRDFTIGAGQTPATADIQFQQINRQHQSVVISARSLEPTVDLRNSEVFNRTLFTRDDQVLQQLNAGINAGQHEGGGKSLEIRRFGFNLDHGGVNGGLKVLVDDVDQNQGTQGHGQGYLGSLKALNGDSSPREESPVTSFVLMPEAGELMHAAHRVPEQMVEVRKREGQPFRYRRLVWVVGRLGRTMGRDREHSAWAVSDATVEPATDREIARWFSP